MGCMENTYHMNRCRTGFAETVAFFLHKPLGGSVMDPCAIGKRQYLFFIQQYVCRRWCLSSAPSPIAKVDEESFNLPFPITYFYSSPTPGCTLEPPGKFGERLPSSPRRDSNSVCLGCVLNTCFICFSAASQVVLFTSRVENHWV